LRLDGLWHLVYNSIRAEVSVSQIFRQANQRGRGDIARNCSPCHGAHMADPEGAFDLRTFPHDQHSRFFNSVTNGKNSMPPWGGLLKPEEIEELWAYVVTGEKVNTNNPNAK